CSCYSFYFSHYFAGYHSVLSSFPTRRSSDLTVRWLSLRWTKLAPYAVAFTARTLKLGFSRIFCQWLVTHSVNKLRSSVGNPSSSVVSGRLSETSSTTLKLSSKRMYFLLVRPMSKTTVMFISSSIYVAVYLNLNFKG